MDLRILTSCIFPTGQIAPQHNDFLVFVFVFVFVWGTGLFWFGFGGFVVVVVVVETGFLCVGLAVLELAL